MTFESRFLVAIIQKQNADLNYTEKARKNVGVGFANDYVEAVKSTELSEDEQKSQYIEELVDKFEDIRKKETKTVFVGEQSTGETEIVPATINDFADKKEFDDYNLWKKGEPISEIGNKTLEAWNINRKQKERIIEYQQIQYCLFTILWTIIVPTSSTGPWCTSIVPRFCSPIIYSQFIFFNIM